MNVDGLSMMLGKVSHILIFPQIRDQHYNLKHHRHQQHQGNRRVKKSNLLQFFLNINLPYWEKAPWLAILPRVWMLMPIIMSNLWINQLIYLAINCLNLFQLLQPVPTPFHGFSFVPIPILFGSDTHYSLTFTGKPMEINKKNAILCKP